MDQNRNQNQFEFDNQNMYGNMQNGNQNGYGMQMPYNGQFSEPARGQNGNYYGNWNMMGNYGGIVYPNYGNDMENQADVRYMKEMYPELAKKIQVYVDEECDQMEYDGSIMFDEYPDRVLIYQIVQRVLNRLMADGGIPESWRRDDSVMDSGQEEAVEAMACQGQCCGRNCRNQGMEDFIQVILLNEMFKRRADRRNRRRRYW